MSIATPKKWPSPHSPWRNPARGLPEAPGISASALAQSLKVPASRINDIVLERRGITVDTAMRLVRYFGGDVQSWMNLQTAFEVKVAQKALTSKIDSEVHPMTMTMGTN